MPDLTTSLTVAFSVDGLTERPPAYQSATNLVGGNFLRFRTNATVTPAQVDLDLLDGVPGYLIVRNLDPENSIVCGNAVDNLDILVPGANWVAFWQLNTTDLWIQATDVRCGVEIFACAPGNFVFSSSSSSTVQSLSSHSSLSSSSTGLRSSSSSSQSSNSSSSSKSSLSSASSPSSQSSSSSSFSSVSSQSSDSSSSSSSTALMSSSSSSSTGLRSSSSQSGLIHAASFETSGVNGTFTPGGTYNTQPYWTNGSYFLWAYSTDGSTWVIGTALGLSIYSNLYSQLTSEIGSSWQVIVTSSASAGVTTVS